MKKSLSELEARAEARATGIGARAGSGDGLAAKTGRVSIEARDGEGVRSSKSMRAAGRTVWAG